MVTGTGFGPPVLRQAGNRQRRSVLAGGGSNGAGVRLLAEVTAAAAESSQSPSCSGDALGAARPPKEKLALEPTAAPPPSSLQ